MLAVVLSVVLGVAVAAPQVFPQHLPLDVARAEFIQEYNRLAALAAAAPDIHIIMRDPTLDQLPAVPAVQNHLTQADPAQHPVHSVFNNFGFTTSLGQNKQFVPAGHTHRIIN